MRRVLAFIVPVVFFGLACGGGGGGGAGGAGGSDTTFTYTWWADVKPIVDAKCVSCHIDGSIGPFALDDYEAAYAQRDIIKLNVTAGIMPPWLAADDCTDYVNNTALTDEQVGIIETWVDEGAPEGDPADAPQALGGDGPRTLDRVDLTVEMPGEYTPTKGPDDYRCFVLDWPETTTKYVTGYRVKPGNDAIVHHVIAFAYGPKDAQTMRDKDAAEAGEGYTCFGDAGGPVQGLITLGAWAPGGSDNILPPGVGIEMEPGAVVILQVHYNTLQSTAQPDLSSVEFQLADTVEKKGAILWFTNFLSWVGGTGMKIPAGEPSVIHSYEVDPSPYMSYITNGTIADNSPFTVYSASLHMHQLGTKAYTSIKHAGGVEACMLDIPRWDFNWQYSYGFTTPKVFTPGDTFFLECEWDNSAANQATVDGQKLDPQDVYWGEGTQDEMCLGVFLVTQ